MKKKIIIITIILSILAIALPLILGLVDKYCCNMSLTVSDWLLTCCSILSLIGTTALAIVAVWQTEKANKQNEALIEQNTELQKINEEQFKIANQDNYPYLRVKETKVEGDNKNDSTIPYFGDNAGFIHLLEKNGLGKVIYCVSCVENDDEVHYRSIYINLRNESSAKILGINIYKVVTDFPIKKTHNVNWELLLLKENYEFYICTKQNGNVRDGVSLSLYFEIQTSSGMTFYQKIYISAGEKSNYIRYNTICRNRIE